MNKLGDYLSFLNLLYDTHLEQQKALLDTATIAQVSVICEILLNIVDGAIDINNEVKKYLNKKSTLVYKLLDKKTSNRKKKTLFKRDIDLLKVILHSIIGFINNESNAAKIYSNPGGEIQASTQESKDTTK